MPKAHARKSLADPAAIRKVIGVTTHAKARSTDKAITNGQPADLAPPGDAQITLAVVAKAKVTEQRIGVEERMQCQSI